MTQDVRIATVIGRLITARQSLHLANMLLGEEDDPAARQPTDRESADITLMLQQILMECKRVARYIELPKEVK
jgi:hypothetical protein